MVYHETNNALSDFLCATFANTVQHFLSDTMALTSIKQIHPFVHFLKSKLQE